MIPRSPYNHSLWPEHVRPRRRRLSTSVIAGTFAVGAACAVGIYAVAFDAARPVATQAAVEPIGRTWTSYAKSEQIGAHREAALATTGAQAVAEAARLRARPSSQSAPVAAVPAVKPVSQQPAKPTVNAGEARKDVGRVAISPPASAPASVAAPVTTGATAPAVPAKAPDVAKPADPVRSEVARVDATRPDVARVDVTTAVDPASAKIVTPATDAEPPVLAKTEPVEEVKPVEKPKPVKVVKKRRPQQQPRQDYYAQQYGQNNAYSYPRYGYAGRSFFPF